MKNTKLLHWLWFVALCITITSCSQNELVNPQKELDKSVTKVSLKAGNTKGVMMQGFYWDVPEGGTWWDHLSGKVSDWSNAGITSVWLPPASKGMTGATSMGYDPFDYFDFGDFYQMGTTETRFGNRAELSNLINTAHYYGIDVYADIVLNHNGGAASEYNPNTGTNTYTDFNPASGMFYRSYNDFHPSTYSQSDEGIFGGFPDLCHDSPYVAGWLWGNSNSVAQYYKNTLGFDGWRFDYVKGFSPNVVSSFVNAAPGFAVAEYWDGDLNLILNYINSTGVSAFDFPCMYAMDEAFDNGNLTALRDWGMVCKSNPDKAVTFVANHDADYVYNNKLSAYAFILTHEGYPCIFYRDYEEWLDKDAINNLIWINKTFVSGSTTVLYADNDEYIAQMSGDPGLVVYINNSGSDLSRGVTTKWSNSIINDFTGNWEEDYTTNASGYTTISAPANSYTVWSYNGTNNTNATITLRMQADVGYGNALYFTGSNSVLTNWGGGVAGSWSADNYWTTTITVPANEQLEFKVLKGPYGSSGDTWESGSNHIISAPTNGTTYTVGFNGGF